MSDSQFSVMVEFDGLTRRVDGVQGDSPGSDEKSNPLQLAVSHVVLKNDIIGEVDTAGLLQRNRSLAADGDSTVLGVGPYSQGLGHRALILHPSQIQCSVCFCRKSGKIPTRLLQRWSLTPSNLRDQSRFSERCQLWTCRKISLQCSCCSVYWHRSCCPEGQWVSLYSLSAYFKRLSFSDETWKMSSPLLRALPLTCGNPVIQRTSQVITASNLCICCHPHMLRCCPY